MTAEEMRELAEDYRRSAEGSHDSPDEEMRDDQMAAAWHQAAALTRIAEALERMVPANPPGWVPSLFEAR